MQLKHGHDGFLILSSDGLNFVLNDNEVVDIVGICQNPQDAATFITDQALQFGTEDNTTVVVIPLGAWGKYRNTTRPIQLWEKPGGRKVWVDLVTQSCI